MALLAGCVMARAAGAAEGWPQFRGPRGDGTAPAAELPLVWNETNHVIWKVRVPGRGRSSPVVFGDRVWLTTAIEEGVQRTRIGPDDMQTAERVGLRAVCLDAASGGVVWEVPLFEVEHPDPVHWLNSWATPTPVIEAGTLYCDFGTFGTAAVEAETGKVRWRQRVPVDHQVGPGSSPVVWQDLLVLVRDGRDAQYVTALNRQTGHTAWRVERPPIAAGHPNLKKSFVTPLVISSGGRAQLVSPGAHWVVAYDPATGAELWRARHGEGFSIGTCPVFGHGLAFFGTGCFKAQLWAVRVDGNGDVTETHVAWKTLRQVPIMSSPVLVGEELYWVSDEGMACCAEARTGQIVWQERLGGAHLASPIATADRLYFFGQEGKTSVVKASRQFEKLAENLVEGPVIATPAAVGGSLYLRNDTHLYRLGGG